MSDGSFLNSWDLVFDGNLTTADNKNIYVESCNQKSKYNACTFCQRTVSKLPRHVTTLYTACAICKGFFSKKSLSRHFERCSGRKSSSRCVLVLRRLTGDKIHQVQAQKLD